MIDIEVGTRVLHIYSKGIKSGVVIPSSGAAAFRDQIHVRWSNGVTDYVLPRFLTVEGEALPVVAEPGLSSIDETFEVESTEAEVLESAVQEHDYEIAEESVESDEPVLVESDWTGFEIREEAQLSASCP